MLLNQAAHAAARIKGTYLSAQYHRLAARIGKKKAIVAVEHSILIIAYHLIQRNELYRELEGDYIDHRQSPGQTLGEARLSGCAPTHYRPHATLNPALFSSQHGLIPSKIEHGVGPLPRVSSATDDVFLPYRPNAVLRSDP